ncbi:MAPEG family protein [Zooshikella marina]|uniref:MAPEG family protein n=1 Tax=Zooshikella ganghwensis TaxID=202772 RepID=UPI001BAF4D0D|nr:MAPEG family protein [Zooshikella ganghwensis]MBU2706894.1 MAPEG family protein [Zooshikella ganghwensis]
MATPLICLVIIAVMPYIYAGIGAYYRSQLPGGIDNKHPRQQISQLQGYGARAYAAQQNAWEALAVFIVAILVAHLRHAPETQTSLFAGLFVVARIFHGFFYIKNLDLLRSLAFAAGLVCVISILWVSW